MGNQRRGGGGNRRPRPNNQRPPQQPKPTAPKPIIVTPKPPVESTLVVGKKVKTGAKHAAVTLSMVGGYAAYRHYKDRDNLR